MKPAGSVKRGATIGALVGLILGLALVVRWLILAPTVTSSAEALEGHVLLAALISFPTSTALFWLCSLPWYPANWLSFILLAPTVQGGLLGALIAFLAKRQRSIQEAAR